ncbi:DUF302 domain-containing protein [bacterium]|nr:DUF302 domain-containing protein [bacterium]
MENLAFTVQLPDNYETALEKVTSALKNEGFGVLTEIDVKATLQKKIGADFRKYAILGACNPPLAHKGLDSEPLIGLLLPCNVTVEETEEGSLVNLVNPKMLLLSNPELAKNQALVEVATDAYDRLLRVSQALASEK